MVVFVAFLVWSLEAEGFVIPTGSMATTLMGRHKEITCPECGYVYTVNADREVDSSGNGRSTGARVETGTCVNCRFETQVGEEPSFSGDRVYVMKLGASVPFLGGARAGGDQAVGRDRLQAARGTRSSLHQAGRRHAERGGSDRGRRPLGPADRLARLSPAAAANARSPAGDADDRL